VLRRNCSPANRKIHRRFPEASYSWSYSSSSSRRRWPAANGRNRSKAMSGRTSASSVESLFSSSKGWRVHALRDCPSPGAEPLRRVSGHPRNFRLVSSAAETCENRRLPKTTQRDAFTHSCRFVYTRPIELHRAGLVAGAARLHAFWPVLSVEMKFARVTGRMPKRLPSRRWAIARRLNAPSLRGRGQPARHSFWSVTALAAG
jgi:hypothetical protein